MWRRILNENPSLLWPQNGRVCNNIIYLKRLLMGYVTHTEQFSITLCVEAMETLILLQRGPGILRYSFASFQAFLPQERASLTVRA